VRLTYRKKNDGGLIRLSVFSIEPSYTCPSLPVPPSCPVSTEYGRGDFCPRGRGGRGGRWGGGGRWCQREGSPGQSNEFPCKNRFERRRAKLTFKRDLWKAYLTSLEQAEGELSPEEERRKLMFTAKVQRLESILSEFGPPPSKTEGLGEKTDVQTDCPVPERYEWVPRQKFHKKERKCKRKEYKKESKNTLSKEDKAEILVLKSQIKELKPVIWGLQEQIKEKKSQVNVLYETTQQKNPELKSEIARLNQEKKAKKAQMEPLKQRIRQLKGK